jgi:hypothetical protein
MWPDEHPIVALLLLAIVPCAIAFVALEWERVQERWAR